MNKELVLSYEILRSVIVDMSYVSIELNKRIDEKKSINKALVTKIVYGVLEKDITLEYFVMQFLKKSPKVEIMILLKMVAYASKAVNSIPPFALVNEVVNIAKSIDRHESGFVNAVSKNLISNQIVLPSKSNKTKYLSIKYSYPEWVIEELLKKHSIDFIEELLAKDLPTDTHIRVNLSKTTAKDFVTTLDTFNIRHTPSLFDYTMYVDYSELLKHDELSGLYVVQGLPSIITCNALGAKNAKVLDTCSAPGGKAVYLESLGNTVYACDIHPHRVSLIKKYASSVGAKNIKTFVTDATQFNEAWENNFEYVLCDVPCSNLGVTRKKPDVLLNRTYSDICTLAGLQYKILENSAKYVKSGGILQYSTCTILDNENKDVIEKFLKNHSDFEKTEIDTFGLDITNEDSLYTFYPNKTNTEGFFIGRLKRK